MDAELLVVIVTSAVCPRRRLAGGFVSVTVVAYVTTELLVVAVGEIAVTVAVEDAPVIAGNEMVAASPTFTSAMSDSALAALTVNLETSAISTKAEDDDEDELLDESVPLPPVFDPPDELELDDELLPLTVLPT